MRNFNLNLKKRFNFHLSTKMTKAKTEIKIKKALLKEQSE